MVTWMSLEGYIAQVFQDFSLYIRLVAGNGERIQFWEDLWWGDQPLSSQFASLYKVILVRNISISGVLGNSYPSSWEEFLFWMT